MRIISGSFRGKRIFAPKKLPVRPTTDRCKEALFNILNNHVVFSTISVLDLCCGIGSISLEFASRGTRQITAVDQHPGCVRFVQQTSQELDAPITMIKSDLFRFLKGCTLQFDIIFADPPYDWAPSEFFRITDEIFGQELLAKNGLLIIEHSKQTNLTTHPNFDMNKNYGGSAFSFFK